MKKHLFFTLVLLFVNQMIFAQLSSDQNYVYSKTNLSADGLKKVETVTYFDGLGRPKQNIAIGASPTGKDLVTPIIYDGFGRQILEVLPIPIATKSKGFHPSITEANANTYYTGAGLGGTAYAEKQLEASPLDRVLQQANPGDPWKMSLGKTIKFAYEANIVSDSVKRYGTVTTWDATNKVFVSNVQVLTFYPANQLYKNKVTDEDGNISYEFKNGEGQTLLVRKIEGSPSVDTYYVYNEYNQLAFVISPKAVSSFKSLANGTILIGAEINMNTTIKELCYVYRYDSKNRLVEKKLPGKGWEYMVYDQQDRLVLTQDAQLRLTTNNFKAKGWLFTKYDVFGRVVYTGFFPNGANRAAMQNALNSMQQNPGNNEVKTTSPTVTLQGMPLYYNNQGFPTGNKTLLSVNYYDTYPVDTPTIPTTILTQSVLPQNAQTSNVSTKSFPTASFVKNIEDDNWTKNYTWYDTKGRAIGSHSINHLGGYTKTESVLDFTGVPQKMVTYHKRLNKTAGVKIEETFSYDHQNRLLVHKHQVNTRPEETLTQNTYNEIGQLKNKKVGGITINSSLQSIDYAYNIRGWMTGINLDALGNFQTGKLFNYKIGYNESLGTLSTKPYTADQSLQIKEKYNGNIATVTWKYNDVPNTPEKKYGYVYDKLNRLLAGFYYQKTGNDFLFTEEHNELQKYDLNGNIDELKRFSYKSGTAPHKIDDLKYSYTGNRVTAITDSGDYSGYEGGGNLISYDDNGNMIDMPDKGISTIAYNFLNLPKQVEISEYMNNSTIIKTDYRVDGVKIKKENKTTIIGIMGRFTTINTTDYLDGFQYLKKHSESDPRYPPIEIPESRVAMEREAFLPESNAIIIDPNDNILNDDLLQFFPTAEGFYDFVENKYIYQYKDHLGNTRLSYTKNSAGVLETVDKNDYYPFGMNHLNSNTASVFGESSYKNYKYNGKELQETGMYAMDWRHYMSDIGRFAVQDPLSGNIPGVTPYRFAFNNPIYFSDPTGLIEEGVNALAYCPTCPKTDEFKPYIDDKNNVYVYNPETNTASLKVTPIEEVVVTGKKNDSNAPVYLGYFNDGVGETGGWLSKNNKGGSVGIWTTPIKGRDFDGIKYNKLNVKYYKDGWKWSKSVKTYGVGNYLKKGSIIGSAVLGAIEIGNGVADDYNDYETKGETYGKNTVKATATVVTSTAVGWAAGAATGAVIGSFIPIPGVGTVVGFIVGAGVGYVAGELAADAVEKAYE